MIPGEFEVELQKFRKNLQVQEVKEKPVRKSLKMNKRVSQA